MQTSLSTDVISELIYAFAASKVQYFAKQSGCARRQQGLIEGYVL